MRPFKEGCRLLEREVNNCLTKYFEEHFEAEDARILRRHFVRFHFRIGTIKGAESIAQKVLRSLPNRYRASAPVNRAVLNHDFGAFVRALPELVSDLSGMEVTLPYLSFLRDFSKGLNTHFRLSSAFVLVRQHDYISEPQGDGYRSIHFQLRWKRLPFELQLRTYLQTSWSRFTHDVVYKTQDTLAPSDEVRSRFRTLSSLLAVSDALADEIFAFYLRERREKRRSH